MIISTTNTVPDREVAEILGLVKGNSVRVRNVGRDILARFRDIVGGEVVEYTKLMAESREQSFDRMVQAAEALGADGVIGIRVSTSMVMKHAAEILVYGTAVRLR